MSTISTTISMTESISSPSVKSNISSSVGLGVSQKGLEEYLSQQNYATKDYVEELIKTNGGVVDFSKYLTSSAAAALYQPIGNYLTEHQSLVGYAKESWVNAQGFLTQHQDLSSYLTSAVAQATYQPKGDYTTQAGVKAQNYLTEHQSLTGYLRSSDAQILYQPKGDYLTPESLTAYATQNGVNEQGFLSAQAAANLYQQKGNYATQDGVQTEINKTSAFNIEIVPSFAEIQKPHTIYLIAREVTKEKNIYDEYMFINNAVERIGSTEIDLSQYAKLIDIPTDSHINSLIETYINNLGNAEEESY